MTSFSIGSTDADFFATEEQFSSKAGLLEELQLKIIVADATTWGALFSLVTPREQLSVRVARSMVGASTIIVDIGGGAGVGQLDLSDTGLDSHDALLVELSSDAPVGLSGPRVARAAFLLIPGT